MKLILGDDHQMFMDALADVLSQHGVMVAARVRTLRDVLIEAMKHQPDICLIAGRWSNGDGVDSIRLMRARHPAVEIVVLSEQPGWSDVVRAIDSGVAAVVSRHERVSDLIEVLRRVRSGERSVGVFTTIPVIHELNPPTGSDGHWLDALTTREQEVLMLIADGRATKEIAKSLAITLHTARSHVQSVLVKLGVHSRLEASGMLARNGLLSSSGHYGISSPRKAAVSG